MAKSKPKSPPVPSRTLKSCFDHTRDLYGHFSHGDFSRTEVAATFNQSATSGPFSQRLFSMKEFGLIEGGADNYKVSGIFKCMHSNAEDSSEFKSAALSAIKHSKVFAELLSEFKDKIPGKHILAQRLELGRGFNNQRAKQAATVLLESLRFAGVLDQKNNILPVRDGMGGFVVEPKNSSASASYQANAERMPHTGSQSEPILAADAKNLLKVEISLPDNRRIVIYYPPDITQDEAMKGGKVLSTIAE